MNGKNIFKSHFANKSENKSNPKDLISAHKTHFENLSLMSCPSQKAFGNIKSGGVKC